MLPSPGRQCVTIPSNPGLAFDLLVDERSCSCAIDTRPRGVHVIASVPGVDCLANCEGVVEVAAIVLVGDGFGVDCRSGDGECGDSGLLNGDARGEP